MLEWAPPTHYSDIIVGSTSVVLLPPEQPHPRLSQAYLECSQKTKCGLAQLEFWATRGNHHGKSVFVYLP